MEAKVTMKMKTTIKLILAGIACAIGIAGAARAADQPAGDASQTARVVMEKVVHDVLSILREQSSSAEQKREKVKQIAYDHLSFEVMGKLSLGKFYRPLSEAQKTEYQKEFKQLITNTYGHTTDEYTDEDVKVTGEQQEQDGDSTVVTHITGTKDGKSGQEIATVKYRLRKTGDEWKVIDFTIDGVSLVSNYRSQFQGIMNSGGIDQLLKMLHDKNSANGK